MSVPPSPSAPSSPRTRAPWYVHLATGALVLCLGVLVLIARPEDAPEAYMLIGSGASFLGVGSGVASSVG